MAKITITIEVTDRDDIEKEIESLLDGYYATRAQALGYAPCTDEVEDAVYSWIEKN